MIGQEEESMPPDAVPSEIPPATGTPERVDRGGAELVPGWLRRLAALGWRALAGVALLVVFLAVARLLWTVTAAILVALIVTATFAPILRRFRTERGWAPTKAAAATSVVALGVVLIAAILIVVAVLPSVVDLLRVAQQGAEDLNSRLASLGLPPRLLEVVSDVIGGVRSWITDALAAVIGPIASATTILILGGFLTFFLLQGGDRAWAKATNELDGRRAKELTERGRIAIERIGAYIRTTAVLSGIDAITQWSFLTLLGLPFAGPIAVITFFGGFAPYLGAIVTTALAVLVALTVSGPTAALVLLALTGATSLLETRFLQPRLYRGNVPLNPALVLVAVPTGAAFAGILGVFVAVPVVAIVQVLGPAVLEVLDASPYPARRSTLVPIWLDRIGQWSWRLLIAFALIWVAIQVLVLVPGVTVPAVIALVLAASLRPGVAALRKRGLGKTAAALTVSVVTLIIVFGTLALTIASLAASLPEVVDEASLGAQNLNLGPTPAQLVRAIGDGAIGSVADALTSIAGILMLIVLAIILTFFFLRDGRDWWGGFLTHVPESRRPAVGRAGADATDILSRYMVGTGLISLFGAITQAAIMWVLGLPLVVPIAVLSFFGGFIPYVGGFITTGLAFLVAVAGGDTRTIVIMAIWTVVFNIVQGNFVAPIVYSRSISLHPAIVLMATPAGAAIAGIMGMFLVVPVVGIVAATWRTVVHLFDPDPVPGAEVAVTGDQPPEEPSRGVDIAPAPAPSG
jgi:predicted PurR-regulated permease PerM